MDIKTLLQTGHSKEITSSIVNAVLSGDVKIKDLMVCFFSQDSRLCQRAAWPVGIIGEKNSKLLQPYVLKMIEAATRPLHNAITRNVVRAFQYMTFNEKVEGEVYDFCFNNVTNLNQPIAVRCFSFHTCLNIAKKHPDLLTEIKELVKIIEVDKTPAVMSVVRNAKKTLNKMEEK